MKRKAPSLPAAARRRRIPSNRHAPAPDTAAPTPEGTASLLKIRCALRPALAIVLGSGFQPLAEALKVCLEVPYADLPGFTPAGVSGHAGKLLLGFLGPTPVAILSGRAHYYEGHSMAQVTFPARTLAAYGIEDLLLTNAAGGVNPQFQPGDFMVLTDHINFMGANPLRGETAAGGERFVDLSHAYDEGLSALLHAASRQCGLRLRTGVYLAVSGPSYETPAEVQAFGRLGADAVGMSTVPEVLAARQAGVRVAGLSCITNLAAGLGKGSLSHAEVLETADRVKTAGTLILKNFVTLYGQHQTGETCERCGPGA